MSWLAQKAGSTEADTGAVAVMAVPVARPAWVSWTNIRPPLAWTASVTCFQATACSSLQMPGAVWYARPDGETAFASAISRPPSEARWR